MRIHKKSKRILALGLASLLFMGTVADSSALIDVKAAEPMEQAIYTEETPESVAGEQGIPEGQTETGTLEVPEEKLPVAPEVSIEPEIPVPEVEAPKVEAPTTEQPTPTIEQTAPEAQTPESKPDVEVKKQEAMELKSDVHDAVGNVIGTVKAKIKAETFAANTSEVTMKVSTVDAGLTKTITDLAKKKIGEEKELGEHFLYKVEFQVNGVTVEPGKEVELTFTPKQFKIDDVKKANVFYYNEAYSPAGNQAPELVEIVQRAEKLEELKQAGADLTNFEKEYDVTDITLHADQTVDKIVTEGRRSTVYGCYLEKDKPEEKPEQGLEDTPEGEESEDLQSLQFENEEVAIEVSEVNLGAIPEGAVLKVVPIEEDNKDTREQYKEVEQKVQEQVEKEEKELGGFLAYDITFVDAKGEKLEPNSEVKVSISYKEAAKPKVEKQKEEYAVEVNVLHLEEDKKGNVKEVVDMDTAGQLDTLQTTEDQAVEKVEVRTESFSVFTITWKYEQKLFGGWKQFEIKVHYGYVDENGKWVEFSEQEMGGKTPQDLIFEGSDEQIEIDLTSESYRLSIPGYDYLDTKVDNQDGTSIAKLKNKRESRKFLGESYEAYLIQYIDAMNVETNWLDSDEKKKSGDIYFIYEKEKPIQPGTIVIEDDIVERGALIANYVVEANETVSKYTWLKADQEDGTYTEVEQIHYQGEKSNISEDGQFLYPAYDTGARQWYQVKATLSTGKEVTSKPFQVPYYDTLQNGGFETPVNTNTGSNQQYSNEEYKGRGGVWQSTGIGKNNQGKMISLEIVRNHKKVESDYSWFGDGTKAAPEGQQFAELNAEAAGALYQDVLTMEGTPLNYYLQHRARGDKKDDVSEYDTMYLVMMPTKEAVGLTTQESLQNYLLKKKGIDITQKYDKPGDETLTTNEQDGVRIIRVTSDDQSWHQVRGTGYIPTTSLTRFFFVAGATDWGGVTVGNFLDDVGFSQNLPPVSDEEFSIQIHKKFAGLDNATLEKVQEKITFAVSIEDEKGVVFEKTISQNEMLEKPDGSLQFTLANQKITKGKTYTVTITEQNAEIDGYSLTAKANAQVRKGEEIVSNQDGTNSVTFSLTGKTISEVTFENTYLRSENKIVNFTKVWDDNENYHQTRPTSLDVTLVPTIEVEEDGKFIEKTLTEEELKVPLTKKLTEKADWKTSWDVPVYYNYKDAKVLIHYTVTEGENTSDYVYEATSESALKGDGTEYTPVFDGTSITAPTTVTPKLNPNTTMSAFSLNRMPEMTLNNQNATELGAPAHKKYVEYNKAEGNYTLNLDVTGATGEATGVDVLFVIDTSGSMSDGGLLRRVKNLLTKSEDGIIDQIFRTEGNVNSVAYVSFAGVRETKVSDWYTAKNKDALEVSINGLQATGGTNWTYAMDKASESLQKRATSKNEKVVIFLSDGEPTYSMENVQHWWGSSYEQTGNGQAGQSSSKKASYCKDAAERVNNSPELQKSKFYSVYLNHSTEKGMKKFDSLLTIKQHECKDGINLKETLSGILEVIIPAYENVVITDTLSNFVEFVDGGEITVTKRTADGTVTTLQENSDYALTRNGKTVSVRFTGKLDDGATYTVSTKIKPNAVANDTYTKSNGYPGGVVGDAGTGVTSAGKQGFYSNDEAQVTYTVNKKEGTVAYPKPVVQVLEHTLKFEKKWNKPTDVEVPIDQVTIQVTYTDGTSEKLTLEKVHDWKLEKSVPITKRIGSVKELSNLSDYEPSYQISRDNTSAVITNNYAKITSQTIKVQKVWVGADNAPKPEVTVGLYRSTDGGDPERVEVATLTEKKGWNHTWNNIPLTATEGDKTVTYTYAVREENIPAGYHSSIAYDYQKDATEVTITNTYDSNCASESYYIANVLQTDDITVDKKWEDNNNALQMRPDTLEITVNNGQGDAYNVSLNSENGWHKKITVLQKKNASYTATEPSVNGYEQSGTTITQTENGATISFVNKVMSKSIIVQKVWHDNDVQDRPEGIKFILEYKIPGENEWKTYGTFDLLKDDILYKEDGTSIPWATEIKDLKADYEYRVIEQVEGCENYTSKVVESEDNGRQVFTIENTLKWKLVKTNLPSGGQNPMYLSGAKFTLEDDNRNQVATGTSGTDGVVTWVWTEGVDSTTLSGKYTLKETESPVGYQLLNTKWSLTFNNGLLTSVGENEEYKEYIDTRKSAADGFVITLKNDVLYELPQSGGTGIYWYLFGGMLLMMAAALIVYKRRRSS